MVVDKGLELSTRKSSVKNKKKKEKRNLEIEAPKNCEKSEKNFGTKEKKKIIICEKFLKLRKKFDEKEICTSAESDENLKKDLTGITFLGRNFVETCVGKDFDNVIKTVKLFEENSENNMKTGSIREEAPSEITENKEGSLQRKIREKSVEEFKPGRKTKFQHVHRMKTLPVMKSSPSRKPQMKPGLVISPMGEFKKVTSISNSTENWKLRRGQLCLQTDYQV